MSQRERKEGRKQKMGSGAGRGKFKGKPTGRRHFSTPEEMGMLVSQPFLLFSFLVGWLVGWLLLLFLCAVL